MKILLLLSLAAFAAAGPVESFLNPQFRLWTAGVLQRVFGVRVMADIEKPPISLKCVVPTESNPVDPAEYCSGPSHY